MLYAATVKHPCGRVYSSFGMSQSELLNSTECNA